MSNLDQPLSDVKVLELCHIVAGPYCSLLLADLGADVIKIEHPDRGDAFRDASPQASSTFNFLNRNKRGITLDLKDDAGRGAFEDLVREADVLVENYSPRAVDSLDIGYETLREVNPDLIYCSVKGFNEGPYQDRPALDPVAEALSGMMSTTGYPDQPPARCGTSVADMAASMQGALSVVSALRQRDHTGEGQHITAPMFESTVNLMGGGIAYSDAFGEPMSPWEGGGQSQWAPYGVFQTSDDKWIFIGPSSDRHWESLCEAMDVPDVAADDRFETLPDRREHRDELDDAFAEVFGSLTRDEILDRLEGFDVPNAPVNNTLEVADDPHLAATGGLAEIRAPQDGAESHRVPTSPIRSSGFSNPEATNPPKQGEHTEAVLASIGYSQERIDALRKRGAI